MAPGVAPCQSILCWQIVTGILWVTATHDVPDHGVGSEEDAASDQHLVEQWNDAEATYGICRPGVNDDAVYVHRQTTERFAIAPDEWELIPVGHNIPPAVILEDVPRVYRDIGAVESTHLVAVPCPRVVWSLYHAHAQVRKLRSCPRE